MGFLSIVFFVLWVLPFIFVPEHQKYLGEILGAIVLLIIFYSTMGRELLIEKKYDPRVGRISWATEKILESLIPIMLLARSAKDIVDIGPVAVIYSGVYLSLTVFVAMAIASLIIFKHVENKIYLSTIYGNVVTWILILILLIFPQITNIIYSTAEPIVDASNYIGEAPRKTYEYQEKRKKVIEEKIRAKRAKKTTAELDESTPFEYQYEESREAKGWLEVYLWEWSFDLWVAGTWADTPKKSYIFFISILMSLAFLPMSPRIILTHRLKKFEKSHYSIFRVNTLLQMILTLVIALVVIALFQLVNYIFLHYEFILSLFISLVIAIGLQTIYVLSEVLGDPKKIEKSMIRADREAQKMWGERHPKK